MHIVRWFSLAGSCGYRRGHVKRPNVIWKEGRKKRIMFFVHFDANCDEFNQLA
jgi:hypothetical protein